jgi:Flp pilus assembly protein TadD
LAGTASNDPGALLARAIERHGAGRLGDAEAGYLAVLRHQPDNADALHLLGVVAHQTARDEQAARLIGRALALRPRVALYHHNMAATMRALSRLDEAITHYRQAAALEPDDPTIHTNLGNALDAADRDEEAVSHYRAALALVPDAADAHSGLAVTLMKLGRHDEAGEHFRRVTEIEPGSASALKNLANWRIGVEDLDGGAALLVRAAALVPDDAGAQVDLGAMLLKLGRPGEARDSLVRAVALAPDHLEARKLLGLALLDLQRYDQAVAQFDTVLASDPRDWEAHNNRAHTLRELGRFDDALVAFDNALAIEPSAVPAAIGRAVLRLAQGDFAGGWRDMLAKTPVEHARSPLSLAAAPPRLTGKTVRIFADQGIGDHLFFLRFAAEIKARGARVAFDPDPKIASIVTRLPLVDEVLLAGRPGEDIELYYAASHLPHVLGMQTISDIPAPVALTPLAERVAETARQLAAFGPPPHVGVTWRAGVQQRNTLFKLVDATALAEALAPTSASVVVLQRAPDAGEVAVFGRSLGRPVLDLSALNDDLEGMLALLSLLDDYVCVSNTNTHLRAGTGRASRVLVPFPPDYRWMGEGAASPWFPGCRVYRQGRDRDWRAALAALRRDVARAFPGPIPL